MCFPFQDADLREISYEQVDSMWIYDIKDIRSHFLSAFKEYLALSREQEVGFRPPF